MGSFISAPSANGQQNATRKVAIMTALGFSAGIPILLIFSSLSLWLREADVSRATVTYFSWAALGYSFKFVWAPLVDTLPLPWLTRLLGRRRAWLMLSQLSIIAAIVLMASVNPGEANTLTQIAMAAVLLGFSSATQDIVIDAYRVESAHNNLQALLSSAYIAGYRIGMLAAGAGAISLASYFGSSAEHYSYEAWRIAYLCMAGCMGVGILTTLLIREPERKQATAQRPTMEYIGLFVIFLLSVSAFVATFSVSAEWASMAKGELKQLWHNGALASTAVETLRLLLATFVAGSVAWLLAKLNVTPSQTIEDTYVAPVRDFFKRYGMYAAILILALIGLYRISDIVMGVIANVFYQDMGFSKLEIAAASKTFGLFMTILGGFLGGLLSIRWGVYRILWIGALLSAATNLLFVVLSHLGHHLPMLYVTISADNISGGLASAAFIAFIASLTNISFTAMQIAIFSSLMTLIPKMLGGYSGAMVDQMGYSEFFIMTALLGLPVLLLLRLTKPYVERAQSNQ